MTPPTVNRNCSLSSSSNVNKKRYHTHDGQVPTALQRIMSSSVRGSGAFTKRLIAPPRLQNLPLCRSLTIVGRRQRRSTRRGK